MVYTVTQNGNQFEWTIVGTDEKGQGTVNGKDVSVSWQGTMSSGSAKGKINTDASGKAISIDWDNGARFDRLAGISQPPEMKKKTVPIPQPNPR